MVVYTHFSLELDDELTSVHWVCAEDNFGNPHPNISKDTIQNARITKLIHLACFDVMRMKSLQKTMPPEFSDVMITQVVCERR